MRLGYRGDTPRNRGNLEAGVGELGEIDGDGLDRGREGGGTETEK